MFLEFSAKMGFTCSKICKPLVQSFSFHRLVDLILEAQNVSQCAANSVVRSATTSATKLTLLVQSASAQGVS